MKPNWQIWQLLLPAIVGVCFCCGCQTTEEADSTLPASKFGKLGTVSKVGIKRESGYKFVDDPEVTSGKKSESAERLLDASKNEKVIKNSKGEVVRKETRGDLYEQDANQARETNHAFRGNKEARIKESKFAQKDFKTPEYLKLQEFNGSKNFRDGATVANESGDNNRQFAGKFFKTETNSTSNQLARENGTSTSRIDKTYRTSTDRTAARAMEKSAVPVGVAGVSGYQDNLEMSMDDVKKLINPSSAR
jgi:hypothetical protein